MKKIMKALMALVAGIVMAGTITGCSSAMDGEYECNFNGTITKLTVDGLVFDMEMNGMSISESMKKDAEKKGVELPGEPFNFVATGENKFDTMQTTIVSHGEDGKDGNTVTVKNVGTATYNPETNILSLEEKSGNKTIKLNCTHL